MHRLIASPFLGKYLLVRPGHPASVRIPVLAAATVDRAAAPDWLRDAARRAMGHGP
ncbi:hypothetical protein [Streptomyces sp. BYX5S]